MKLLKVQKKVLSIALTNILTAGLLCGTASAHSGHDHGTSKGVQAQKGGVIKSLEHTHVELVAKGKDLKVYLFNKDDKALDALDVAPFTVTAKAELPRTKKSENVELKAMGKHLEGTFDAKGSHRYTLHLTVKDPKADHEDTLKFTVEPGK